MISSSVFEKSIQYNLFNKLGFIYLLPCLLNVLIMITFSYQACCFCYRALYDDGLAKRFAFAKELIKK
ncbi:hypothetical protein XBO1_2060008 [Xenorhabdus bovienii str. oregonense]|uniref:Uncharacterized protein n=1 Tax=Xenorhabdus bovienii str. oregonense TaxID=1398202 RepID=A0A077NUF2_XENBV|nr:hypothetical protein XBO1_2060008 [Xenorhabdus bovienii str. oregonense]